MSRGSWSKQAALALGAALALAAGCGSSETGNSSSSDAGTGGEGDGGSGPTTCTTDDECTGGRLCCGHECIEVDADPENCGECGNACGEPLGGTASCVGGACQVACVSGYGDCDVLFTNGCEVTLTGDPLNCGGCGIACLFANAEADCQASECVLLSCKAGFGDCNQSVDDGCEADLSNDGLHCNSCDVACDAAPNAEPYCLAGACAAGPCKNGFADCDPGVPGCEVDLFANPQNCGSCGTTCPALPNASTACVNAVCSVGTCDAGHADCDKSVWSGCESVLATDVANCNGCGTACPAVAHGYPGCAAGVCGVGGCDPGFADCDDDPTNGCEVDLASDESNCAACGNICPPVSQGSPVCAGFQCGIGACVAPYADCFSGAVDGCETNLETSVDHCGNCATICPLVDHGSRGCANGSCGIGACAAGFDDCNHQASDGCEGNLKTDVSNCGACGNVCPTPANGVAGCVNGGCVLAGCNTGYSNCDGDPGNGCEFNTLVDANNCGGCGIVCGSGTCASSACQCNKAVLVIPDDYTAGADGLVAALTAAGYPAQKATKPSYQYDGASPALTSAAFGAVIVLTGTSGASTTTDMPAAGQTAIVNFVNTLGNGVVFTEWAALHVSKGRWQTLAPLVLLNRTNAFTGKVTYAVDAAFAAHPLWAGLPSSFQFNSTTNIGLTTIASGGLRVASSPQALDGVALRDTPKGRVVHVSHAGSYSTTNGWSDTNIKKLMANAAGWVARCN